MSSIAIAFTLAHTPLRTGAYPVRCRITIRRKHTYFNTPFQVQSPSEFDELKQCFTKNKNGNARLNIMRGEIQTMYGQLMHENPTAQTIKHRYLNSFDSKAVVLYL